ncbi:hypothetical protein Ahy_A06g026538 [Arachis hypogaea]|uniref:Uncharacterized protein n=1 Tax=Arachis hypogaea TaxID=3818 RepID=A0A445CKS7_ARAHY|nr:hypothetical protein Ahy_A06g026538 [Arachis hypogaea]
MRRKNFKSKPTGRHQFSTPEDLQVVALPHLEAEVEESTIKTSNPFILWQFPLLNSVDALWTLIMDLLLNMGSTGIENMVGFEARYSLLRAGFHVDDSEVTLNICLGKEFSGGELFFRGARCDAHVNSDSQLEKLNTEILISHR